MRRLQARQSGPPFLQLRLLVPLSVYSRVKRGTQLQRWPQRKWGYWVSWFTARTAEDSIAEGAPAADMSKATYRAIPLRLLRNWKLTTGGSGSLRPIMCSWYGAIRRGPFLLATSTRPLGIQLQGTQRLSQRGTVKNMWSAAPAKPPQRYNATTSYWRCC